MKTVTANFTNMRLNNTIPGTKTRITISEYDNTWIFQADTDVTDRLIGKLPEISMEIEKEAHEFVKDSVVIDLEDQDQTIRNMLNTDGYHYLIKIEKGFDGIADWVVMFDGIINPMETICKGRNITSITAYSMEEELEYCPAWQVYDNTAAPLPNINGLGPAFTILAINVGGGMPGVKKMEYKYDSAAGNPYILTYDGGTSVAWGLNVTQWIYDHTGTHGLQIQSSNNGANFQTEDQSDTFVIGDLTVLGSIGNWYANRSLTNLVGDLWDLSNINIPVGNRTISVPAVNVPFADFSHLNAREGLNELAVAYGCTHKRLERDVASFISRSDIVGTFNLDTDLYKPSYEYTWRNGCDGVYVKNSFHTPGTRYYLENVRTGSIIPIGRHGSVALKRVESLQNYVAEEAAAYSAGYIEGENKEIDNRFITTANHCWIAEEIFSWNRFDRRVFLIPAFFLIELEPMDRVNLTLRDKDGNLDETIACVVTGSTYSDADKITELKLEERELVIYERWVCNDVGGATIAGFNWKAQTYTLGTEGIDLAHRLMRVRLKLYRINNPGNCTLGVRTTAGGQPAGADLATDTISANAFTTSTLGQWYEFTFPLGALQAATTQYALVLRAPAAPGGSSVEWRRSDPAHPTFPVNYTGGQEWDSGDSGATWAGANFDLMFENWGELQ